MCDFEKYPSIFAPISDSDNEKLVTEHSVWGLANAVSTLIRIVQHRDTRISGLEAEREVKG